MNVTFTGTENRAAKCEIGNNHQGHYIKNTFTCTPNNQGKRDLYELEPVMDEFYPYGNRSGNKSIVVSVTNQLSDAELQELKKNFNSFIAKYDPPGDIITINEKPVIQSKSRLYVFQKLQELADDINEGVHIKSPADTKKINLNQIAINLLGKTMQNEEELAPFLNDKIIRLNTDLVSKSMSNLIKRIKAGK